MAGFCLSVLLTLETQLGLRFPHHSTACSALLLQVLYSLLLTASAGKIKEVRPVTSLFPCSFLA
jgi:hypothetical protein